MNNKNKFIVIEGLDGAGKSTQVNKLIESLNNNDEKVHYIHFPRTNTPYYGEMISKFLRGELGSLNEVDPYLVAFLYATDRTDFAPQLRKWLDDGHWIVLDRYVYSNVAYQCAKTDNFNEAEKLANWILDFEYYHNNIPKPALSIFLDVPFLFTCNKLKNNRNGDDREYLNGKQDIHESDLNFQKKVRETYLWLAQNNNDLEIINCCDEKDNMLSPDEISKMILQKLTILE